MPFVHRSKMDFAKGANWVSITQGGLETLQERLAVRPTSETLFCELFSKTVQSDRAEYPFHHG